MPRQIAADGSTGTPATRLDGSAYGPQTRLDDPASSDSVTATAGSPPTVLASSSSGGADGGVHASAQTASRIAADGSTGTPATRLDGSAYGPQARLDESVSSGAITATAGSPPTVSASSSSGGADGGVHASTQTASGMAADSSTGRPATRLDGPAYDPEARLGDPSRATARW